MRSDFIGNCMEFPSLPEAINDGQYLVPRLNREELRATITGPIAVGGGEITPRLVLRLLNDVGDDPDQLPVLQHAMMRLWDCWQESSDANASIDLRHYEDIGTLKEALSKHAEEAYAELDSGRERLIAEILFKVLTDKDAEGKDARRPAQLKEICAVTEASLNDIINVIARFRQIGRSFLMPPAKDELAEYSVIDISHESFMRIWQRLSGWVDEEAQSAQIYRRLIEAAELHQEKKAGLWRDPELEFALQWQHKKRPTSTWAARYGGAFELSMRFLQVSVDARDYKQNGN
jgi:hypothetical protein